MFRFIPCRGIMLILAALISLQATTGFAQQAKTLINQSGLPLPRFVSLSFDQVNVRAGPGVNYPLKWTFTRRQMPLKVLGEYDNWRQIEDQEGATGWVHKSQLTGRRTGLVRTGMHMVMSDPGPDSFVEFTVEGGVILGLSACKGGWCEVVIGDKRGWIQRAAIWGTLKGEQFD